MFIYKQWTGQANKQTKHKAYSMYELKAGQLEKLSGENRKALTCTVYLFEAILLSIPLTYNNNISNWFASCVLALPTVYKHIFFHSCRCTWHVAILCKLLITEKSIRNCTLHFNDVSKKHCIFNSKSWILEWGSNSRPFVFSSCNKECF